MKIFRAYIITVIACISIASTVACIFIADENARKISLGEEFAVVVMSSAEESLDENEINPLPAIRKIAEGIKRAASIAPPPVSNIYWFIQGIEQSQK
ncbi:MAG: hypothetical protein IJZ07_07720 [Clostridia bacterium]|nr:hypothetical protein [Clostridia bacterium]